MRVGVLDAGVCVMVGLPVEVGVALGAPHGLLYRSTSVWDWWTPTAHTSLLDVAATPMRSLASEPTFGLSTKFHRVPSQCAVSVCPAQLPTAQTSLLDKAV